MPRIEHKIQLAVPKRSPTAWHAGLSHFLLVAAHMNNNTILSQHTEASSRSMVTATGDEVFPARFWDTNDFFKKIVMEFTYRFDDVLNAEKLRSSLERLLEIGEWRNLGARFKENVGPVRCRS
jgi:hypothetical protein